MSNAESSNEKKKKRYDDLTKSIDIVPDVPPVKKENTR